MLLLGRGLSTIPGNRAAKKVYERIGKGFQVVMAWLFSPLMAVEWCRWGGTCEDTIMLLVWDVVMGPSILVLLGKAKINDVYTSLQWGPILIKKLAGLMSQWMKWEEYTCSMCEICAISKLVEYLATKLNKYMYYLVCQKQDCCRIKYLCWIYVEVKWKQWHCGKWSWTFIVAVTLSQWLFNKVHPFLTGSHDMPHFTSLTFAYKLFTSNEWKFGLHKDFK